jgi:effector-binding domain-containing protein
MDSSLANLKAFMENPVQFYGFPIELRPIADTLLLFKKTTISKKDLIATLQKNYTDLRNYAKENDIPISNNRIAGFIEVPNNQVQMITCIPVDKRAADKNDISYMTMPVKGRMVVGSFEGDYNNIHQIYRSIDRYMTDNSLQKVTIPYEKYYTDPKSAQDSLHMKIEVCFPIF